MSNERYTVILTWKEISTQRILKSNKMFVCESVREY